MMAILGWIVMCVIAGVFWIATGFWLFIAACFSKGGECMVMTVIFLALALAFSYGVVVHYPFEPLALKGVS